MLNMFKRMISGRNIVRWGLMNVIVSEQIESGVAKEFKSAGNPGFRLMR